MRTDTLSLSDARRIALAAQGFDRPRPKGRIETRHLRATLARLGLVQMDYVNVLVPAHYLPLFSRLGPYDRSQMDDLIYRQREFTEQWAHEASILPTSCWPLVRHLMGVNDRRARALAQFMEKHATYATWVLEEVRTRGALVAEEVLEPDGTKGRRGDWWGWTTAKATLEGHFASGALAVSERRRVGFARAYDLTERVIPQEHHACQVEREDAQRELLRRAARSHGVGTVADLADYYRMTIRDARTRIDELVEAKELRQVRVEGWREPAYLHPEAKSPRRIGASALLSPFDPVVWYRPRTERLFRFEYRIEIYTPKEKRRWGYYVLPFLLGDRLVARVDLKADRKAKRLLVLAAHVEEHAEAEAVAAPLAKELRTMGEWLGLEAVSVARKGRLARALGTEVKLSS